MSKDLKNYKFQKVGTTLSTFHDKESNKGVDPQPDSLCPNPISHGCHTSVVNHASAEVPYSEKGNLKVDCGKSRASKGKKSQNESDLSEVLHIKAQKIRNRILQEMREETVLENDESCPVLNIEIKPAPEPSFNRMVDHSSRIPVSQARGKRREKPKTDFVHGPMKIKEQNTRHVQSTVDIRRYRPSYTWNKGGRVKELRFRCLARKFLYLWQRKIFGRVSLSVAINHFEEALKKKTFAMWYDFWWEIVKEWRLGVRAECHSRHKLCLHVFAAWRQFVHMQREKHSKSQNAIQKYNQNLRHKTWHCWLAYIKINHAQLTLKAKADKFHEVALSRYAWIEWRHQFLILESQKENFATALQFWSYRLQAQHWLVWKNAFHVRKHIEEQYKNASIYHNTTVVLKCLRAWKLYNDNKQVKKAHYAFAERKYTVQMKANCFHHWFQRWHLLKSLQQHKNHMESLAKNFRMRWALWRWKTYVDFHNMEKEKELVAQHHYDLYLLRLGFDSFRLNVVHSQIKVMRNKLSNQLAASQLTRWAWKKWMGSFDHREEMRLVSSTETAHHHYRVNLLYKCFQSLNEYSERRKLRKIQYAQADAHFFLHAAPKTLFHMKLNVELEKKCRQNALESHNFYRSTSVKKAFQIWYNHFVRSRDERMLYRMAVLHHESVSLRIAFSFWQEKTVEKEKERENVLQAERHYIFLLFQKSFYAWQCYVDMRRNSALNERKAVMHHSYTMARKSFVQWKKWIHYKAQRRMKVEIAEKHYSKRVLTSCMSTLKKVVEQGRKFRSLANEKYEILQKRILRQSFHEWQKVSSLMADKKRKEEVAKIYYNRNLLSKMILEWHQYAAVKAYKYCQTQELLSNAVFQLQKLRLELCWKRWIQESNKMKETKTQFEKASHHFDLSVQQRIFHCWKIYTRGCLRKRLLSRQSQWFHDVRLSAKHFLTWQERLKDKREENEKSQLALWHWSLSLQRKVIIAWNSYKNHQRHKKQRLIEAAIWRREQLLRSACCQWLTTADSLYQVRSTMAAHYQTKAVMDSFLLVQRCALHWRSWARKRMLARVNSEPRANHFAVPLVAKGRVGYKSSEIPLLTSVLPSQMIRSAAVENYSKPQTSTISPLRHGTSLSNASKNGFVQKQRPLPKRPSFLIDSLQRAGLYSQMFSEAMADLKGDMEDNDTTSSIADELHAVGSPDHPSTGRFELHNMPPSERTKMSPKDTEIKADSSLSAEVLSGSNSTLEPANSALKPLHLSNTDTDYGSTQTTTSSHSPPLFTPSTQRSQFSGNPLLYSSPVSDSGAAKPSDVENAENMSIGDQEIDGLVVRGNLEGADRVNEFQRNLFSSKEQSQNQFGDKSHEIDRKKLNSKETRLQDDTFVIWKPEDFMKKPPLREKVRRLSSEEPLGARVKHTPRAFATWELEKLSEYAEEEGQNVKSSDLTREGKGVLRHTPREVFSPRRAAPQGILHNKVSDSDGDVSPLNTARSRGTVTFASPKSPTPEEEIINIRDRLRHFAQQKRKLKSLRKQYRQLSDWLVAQAQNDKQSDEDDSHNASEELDMIRLEVAQLQAFVDGQRPICERLVLRAQSIVSELNINIPFD